jgi:hypothetical protein
MNWKIPYYAESTASIVRRNWLMLTMGPNHTAEKEDVDVEDVPDWMKRRDKEPYRRTR